MLVRRLAQWSQSRDRVLANDSPRAPEDLRELDWITHTGFDGPQAWTSAGERGARTAVKVAGRIKADSAAALLAFVLAARHRPDDRAPTGASSSPNKGSTPCIPTRATCQPRSGASWTSCGATSPADHANQRLHRAVFRLR